MSITEESRHQMFEALRRALGPEHAATLMEHLPPVGWADVATKRDLDHTEALLRGDLDRVESNLRGDLDRVESNLRGEIDTKVTGCENRLLREISQLRGEVGRDVRTFATATMAVNAAAVGAAVALSRLL